MDLRNKALRYGWPPDAGVVPVVLRLGPEGAGDAVEADARLMAVALAAVTAHDARGLVAVGGSSQATKGNLTLGDGRTTSFSIAQKPPAPKPEVALLRFHQAGLDIVPEGAHVVLGHLPWESVAYLRASGRVHRPLPTGAPGAAGSEVPLLAILPEPKTGANIAAKVVQLDPLGSWWSPTMTVTRSSSSWALKERIY